MRLQATEKLVLDVSNWINWKAGYKNKFDERKMNGHFFLKSQEFLFCQKIQRFHFCLVIHISSAEAIRSCHENSISWHKAFHLVLGIFNEEQGFLFWNCHTVRAMNEEKNWAWVEFICWSLAYFARFLSSRGKGNLK